MSTQRPQDTQPPEAETRSADPDSEPFFAGLRRGELLLQTCERCQRPQFPPRAFCGSCGGRELAWQPAQGLGSVYSLTVCHRAGTPEMSDRVPFVVGLVDLVEGVRLLARLRVEPQRAAIGMRVRPVFPPTSDGAALEFEPEDEPGRG